MIHDDTDDVDEELMQKYIFDEYDNEDAFRYT